MRRMFSLKQLQEIASDQVKSVKKDISTLVDGDGHERFIEGDITAGEISGITFTYAKWSLSGTHLMLVIAGNVIDNTSLADGKTFGTASIPSWLLDKIIPYTSTYVDLKMLNVKTSGYAQYEVGLLTLGKETNSLRIYNNSGTHTISNAGTFRIEFDLLIDNE